MADICTIENLTFRYFEESDRNVLENVSLSFKEGSITVILGASGCGKSTLAAVMCGLYPENGGYMESGTITVAGKDLKGLPCSERVAYISQMFQNPELQFCMKTLREELRFCLENLRVPVMEMDGRIRALAEEYHVGQLLDRPFFTLSGGEKQRAALCCLFLLDPQVMVLDEPFANLDDAAAEAYLVLLKKKTAEGGTTVIAIDHRAAAWRDTADTYVILGDKGRPAGDAIPAKALLQSRSIFLENGLVDPVEDPVFRGGHPSEETILQLTDVSVYHKKNGEPMLQHVQLQAGKGEMIACLGASGGGKTSLFMTLLGRKPYRGSIRFAGKELKTIRERDLFANVGIVFQNPANQFVKLRVLEEVAVSISIWKGVSKEAAEAEANALLEDYGLKNYRMFSPYMLSQGQQRRLGVLSVLAGGQQMLLLDEPTYGQDGQTSMAIMQQMQERKKEGVTILFSTHDRTLAAKYADRIWHVEGGTAYEEC